MPLQNHLQNHPQNLVSQPPSETIEPTIRSRISSSLIASSHTEVEQVMDDYWIWKTLATTYPSRKVGLAAARELIEKEMWTIEHLKQMSDTLSESYKQAVSKGLPSGLAASFKEDFREFKQVYRTQYRPGRFLMEIRQDKCKRISY
jgi:hypothetical protein